MEIICLKIRESVIFNRTEQQPLYYVRVYINNVGRCKQQFILNLISKWRPKMS